MDKLKIAVLGSTGMAGSMIYHYFKNKKHLVTGFGRSIINGYMDVHFDAHNKYHLDKLTDYIDTQYPDVIINCIGYLVKESNKNPAEAVYLNSYFPHILENITKGTNTKVIHLSTDCIFDGKDVNGYKESSLPTETNYYGRSKALGELNNGKDLTLRQSIIGPAPQATNSGFLNWILTEISPEVSGWSTAMWNGITTLELAKQIEGILLICPQLSGIVHLEPPEITSKCTLIEMIIEEWNLPLKLKRISDKPFSYKLLRAERLDAPLLKSNYKKQLKELHTYMKKHNIEVGKLI